jgi:ribosomal protein L17
MRKNGESKGFTESEKNSTQMKKTVSNKLKSLIRNQKIETSYKKVNDSELINPYAEGVREGKKTRKNKTLLSKIKKIINKKR